MRRDARKLLEKLNRKDFSYKIFDDSFSETELWPIFEAVLCDQQVVGELSATPAVHEAVKAPTASAPRPNAAPHQMFAQYGLSARKGTEPRDVDLGAFFKRFSEME